ncbi:MAG TPA: YqgE/AlgH family protein [Thermoanaerobaculia bacterium]|nr:YqgE/AlgH family protein [Thermoanaerobaculia bacterium]
MPITDTLETPVFLIAMRQVVDPFFHRSVVLLLEHDEGGSFGLIVNRPTDVSMSQLLSGLGVPWGGDAEAQSWFGGPVQPGVGTVLYAGAEPHEDGEDTAHEIAAGLCISRDIRVLTRLASAPPPEFRLFLGYAGWGAGQLAQEIERSDWLTAPFDRATLFRSDPTEMWTRALASIGIRPESLPTWAMPGEDEKAN